MGKNRGWGCRVLPYIYDLSIAPAVGRASTKDDCVQFSTPIGLLMRMFDLVCHWPVISGRASGVRGCVVEHLGSGRDSVRLLFTVCQAKQDKVRTHSRDLLRQMARAEVRSAETLCGPLLEWQPPCTSLFPSLSSTQGRSISFFQKFLRRGSLRREATRERG